MTRLFYLTLLLLGLRANSPVKSQGIEFVHDSTLAQLKARAKAINKPIFIDCYTTWCGPCKWMAKNIFPMDSVGTVFNAGFVCAKIDMEKGDGRNMASLFKIQGYPTFLFLDTAGKEIHRFMGSQPARDFITNSSVALDQENNLAGLKKRYKAGERSTQFLRKYISAAASAGEDVQVQVDWYMALVSNDELATAEHFLFFSEIVSFLRYDGFLRAYENRATYSAAHGAEAVTDFIKGFFEKEHRQCYEKRETSPGSGQYKLFQIMDKRARVLAMIDAAEFEGKEEFEQEILFSHLQWTEDIPGILELMKKHSSHEAWKLNSVAWMVYEKSDNKDELKQALALSKKSIELENSYANNDTYAALWYKLGNKKEAKKAAEKAIALAKQDNEDYSETEKLLTKINAMK